MNTAYGMVLQKLMLFYKNILHLKNKRNACCAFSTWHTAAAALSTLSRCLTSLSQ